MNDDLALEANEYFNRYPPEALAASTNDHYQTEERGFWNFSFPNFFCNPFKNYGNDSLICEDSKQGNFVQGRKNFKENNAVEIVNQAINNSASAASSSFDNLDGTTYPNITGVFESFIEALGKKNNSNKQIKSKNCNKTSKALEYFETDNLEGTSNGKIDDEFMADLNHHKINKNLGRKTLGDSIKYFKLSDQLQQLEISIEDVRRNKKDKEKHEELFKKIDKEIQKLSFKYHPDKIKNSGGTEAVIEKAQKEQTALNCIRTALKILNSEFMEDIAIDHKFEYYTDLHIDTICNEDEVQNRTFEVILKTGMLSHIKQQNIISEIREFLIESKNCVQSYLDHKITEFKTHRNLALFHLKCCIEGFEKLCSEFDKIKKECKTEKSSENMFMIMQKMAHDCKKHLRLLKSLQDTAEVARMGIYRFFNPLEEVDSYFVLPFVYYVNVILMCNVMVRKSRYVDTVLNTYFYTSELDLPDGDLKDLVDPYYLTSYCSGDKSHKRKVLEILGKTDVLKKNKINENNVDINKLEIESKFRKCILPFIEKMEDEIKIQYYTGTMATDILVLEIKKCLNSLSEFEQKERKVSKKLEEFQKKTEMMEEKYGKLDEMIAQIEDMRQNVKDRLEKSRECRESLKDIF